MSIYSICGASGTGKSTLIREIKAHRPDWAVRSEATRRLVPIMGYSSPWEIINQCGIGFYEALMIASWAMLDELDTVAPVILDRSPLDNYCYFRCLQRPEEARYEQALHRLALHYASRVDHFFLLPFGVFPFRRDEMRELDIQAIFDRELRLVLQQAGATISEIKERTVSTRAERIIQTIEAWHHAE